MMKGRKNASAFVFVMICVAIISQIVCLSSLYFFVTNLFNCWASLLIDGLCLLPWPIWLLLWPDIWLAFSISFWQSMIVCLEEGLEIPLFYPLSVPFVVV